jgi:hypothetical protein
LKEIRACTEDNEETAHERPISDAARKRRVDLRGKSPDEALSAAVSQQGIL